jgi:DNA-binding response OmpR family regulator
MVLANVWGEAHGIQSESLRAYMNRLRRKLGQAGASRLRNKPGIGYYVAAD